MISNQNDLFCLIISLIGVSGTLILFSLHDFDIMKLLFCEEKEIRMRRVSGVEELEIGQTIYLEEDQKKEHVIRSIEDKLLPYVIIEDSSSHFLSKGIWIES